MNANNIARPTPDVHELFAALTPEEQARAVAGADAWFATVLARSWRRRSSRSRLRAGLRAYSEALVGYRTEGELLDALLAVGRPLGVGRIRYHHYDARAQRLLSIDCAGHGPDEALRLRLGNIVRPRRACPPNTSDSFVCLDRAKPVLFMIDAAQEALMAEREPLGRLLVIALSRWQCDDVLCDSSYRFRVDYPLMHVGGLVGKLSCDLEFDQLTPRVARQLLWFWKIALRVAAPIEGLRATKVESVVPVSEGVRDEILAATTLRKLFDYCVDELPKRFGILHASLFTVSTDATGSTRLILRRTSYPASRHLENGARGPGDQVGYYQIAPVPDNSITTWVARSHRTVRVQHLSDRALLRSQLVVLSPEVRWMNKIQDSSTHTSFLAVPVLAGGRLLGVLRLTEKAAGDARSYFTDIEEKTLSRIATDHLGPRLAELHIREAQQLFCDEEWQQPVVRALAETFEPTADTQTDRRRRVNLQMAMRYLFREDSRSRHLYLVNHVPVNGQRFTHLAVAGPLVHQIEDRLHNSYELEGTLTGEAIRSQKWVYLHDIREATERRVILPLLPGETESVLACPISLGVRGRGAIVMHSDRHDIVPEVHGPLLHYLTSLTTGLLTCRCRPGSMRP
jgi:GAF domain